MIEESIIFNNYIKQYDMQNEKIRLKVAHTYRVVEVVSRLAKELHLSATDTHLAQLIALLHDIGRFEQVKLYDSFFDLQTEDHAKLGLKILFEQGFIRDFIATTTFDSILYKAILNHNQFQIEEGLSPRELLHAKLLRDADKTDIFYVNTHEPLSLLYPHLEEETISDELFNAFIQHKQLPRKFIHSDLERFINSISFIYDYNFIESLKIVKEKNYIPMMFERILVKQPSTIQKLQLILSVAEEYIDAKINMEK